MSQGNKTQGNKSQGKTLKGSKPQSGHSKPKSNGVKAKSNEGKPKSVDKKAKPYVGKAKKVKSEVLTVYDFTPESIKEETLEVDPNLMTLDITDIGDDGEGIGRFEGLTVFVPGALPGDKVTCKPYENKKSYAKARLIKIDKPSKHRVEPPCPVFGVCGGCRSSALYAASRKRRIRPRNCSKHGAGIALC